MVFEPFFELSTVLFKFLSSFFYTADLGFLSFVNEVDNCFLLRTRPYGVFVHFLRNSLLPVVLVLLKAEDWVD